jgi:hypothetical protein
MNPKIVDKMGWLASFMAMAMYFSYIDQIRLNVSGQPGSVFLPIITTINCITWALYGFFKIKRDWPIVIANIPGIIIGATTAVTAVI